MKVIITDCDHDNINIEKNIFNEAGIDFELKQAITEEAVISLCSGADVLVVQYAKITRKVMQNCPNLKYIVRYGVGVDTIEIKRLLLRNWILLKKQILIRFYENLMLSRYIALQIKILICLTNQHFLK